MVPKGMNGEGWASISWEFQAIVNSFVTGDKAKLQMVDKSNQQGMTCQSYGKLTGSTECRPTVANVKGKGD